VKSSETCAFSTWLIHSSNFNIVVNLNHRPCLRRNWCPLLGNCCFRRWMNFCWTLSVNLRRGRSFWIRRFFRLLLRWILLSYRRLLLERCSILRWWMGLCWRQVIEHWCCRTHLCRRRSCTMSDIAWSWWTLLLRMRWLITHRNLLLELMLLSLIDIMLGSLLLGWV